MTDAKHLVSHDDILQAQDVIKDKVHRTPTMRSSYFSDQLGLNLHLKLELFQKTGSFKVRGVTNKMKSLTPQEKQNGVISLSAGNHAQAVAWGAAQYGIPATIIMPANSVPSKQAATQGYGGEVLLTDGNLLDYCLEVQQARNLYLVHPFDDLKIIAGHGVAGVEVMEDVPDVDTVLVGIGGGGLISGVATAIKSQNPSVTVIGVEPTGAPTMTRSLAKNAPEHLSQLNTVADGLAAPFVGQHNLHHVQQFVDEVILVTDAEILQALRLIWERCKVLAEPAACASVAALLSGKVRPKPGSTVLCMISGGNVDLAAVQTLLG
ncbi:MAG: threonine/serine dehydratase [Chloroflexota bacterium]